MWTASSEAAVAKLLAECATSGADPLYVEASMFKAEVHLTAWQKDLAARQGQHRRDGISTAAGHTGNMQNAVLVWRIIAGLWNGRVPGEPGRMAHGSTDMVRSASAMLMALGFADTAALLARTIQSAPVRRTGSQGNACGVDIFRYMLVQSNGHSIAPQRYCTLNSAPCSCACSRVDVSSIWTTAEFTDMPVFWA